MRANPGGEISPDEVVGRDQLIENLWRTLKRQSAVLVAERRMGKSTIIKKMVAEKSKGILPFYRDLEGIDSPIAFAERLYQDVEAYLGTRQRTADRARTILRHLAGTEIAGLVKFPSAAAPLWKEILGKTIEDLLEHQQDLVLFFWDELPLMLQKIGQSSGPRDAMEVLDLLRSLRQTHPRLRMIFTGSIGLHHVTTSLRDQGHSNDATNDMKTMEVPPLGERDAITLATKLLRGEGLISSDLETTAQAIALEVDGIPFYIHYVVSSLRDLGQRAEVELAKEVVKEALVAAQDVWHLGHYRDRLKGYYGEPRLATTLFLLDELSTNDRLSFDDLKRRLSAALRPKDDSFLRSILDGDDEPLRRLLLLLQRDHYLRRDLDLGHYCFRFPLIRRWWRLDRGI